MKFQFCLTDSLEKVMPKKQPRQLASQEIVLFGNQRYSFQIAYTCIEDEASGWDRCFRPVMEGLPAEAVTLRKVGLVPSDYPCHGTWDEDYLTTDPGLLPDILEPWAWGEPVQAVPAQWRSLWITVNAACLPCGTTVLELSLLSGTGEVLASFPLHFQVLEETLPAATLYHTEWFHADCIAGYYHQEVFSEPHWKAIDAFMESAAQHGVNMLLTPVFTPPLDTAKGGERTTVQLVDVFEKDGSYSFDFEKLRRWVNLCKSHGITEIEISHLFTQWGAVAAPKVMVHTERGLEKRFGWHTPAVGGEYTRFLESFLPALKEELAQLVGLDHVWFHISDEPGDAEKESYAAARNSVSSLLEGCRVMDALSSYAFYEEGLVKKPVVSEDHLQTFADHKVKGLWTYYCTAQAVKVPNRFMAMPSTRNRILGTLLYVYQIEGFLHWGFNFYNSQYSLRLIDPFRITDAGEAFPSGDAFLVYPGPDGTPWDSIRGEVLKEAQQDLRLLHLCESRIGRERTLELLREEGGEMSFTDYPQDAESFSRLWHRIQEELRKDCSRT